ncbi:MAG: nitrogenase cofactor biosynthesis protein NifB [Gammaproteobacteria bacterium]
MTHELVNSTILHGSGPVCSPTACVRRPRREVPEDIREKIRHHPCFSEEAHHHYARIHLAVAPACNIRCHYCNRKYDCANESRPGVVSQRLTPEQAVKKALVVGAVIPQLSVVGIAGPGEPLANPRRTFATLRGIAEQAPDLRLCLSTNGLRLPEYAEELAKLHVDHVTITLNAIDPVIGARIHPWIFWQGKRLMGERGARVLIEQQQEGLRRLTRLGVLVKINSVMIPGINDQHLPEVNRWVSAQGAFLHNILPLIAEPRHGTFFGLSGQRAPTPAELKAVQDGCGGEITMMRHCRQCRADAVGLLGQDQGALFSMEAIESMEVDYPAALRKRAKVRMAIDRKQASKSPDRRPEVVFSTGRFNGSLLDQAKSQPALLIAVATRGGGLINEHFGAASEFLVYEVGPQGVRLVGVRRTQRYCAGPTHCRQREEVLATAIQALQGCAAVLCAQIGFEPWSALEEAGIVPNAEHADGPIEGAVETIYQELLASGRYQRWEPKVASGSA